MFFHRANRRLLIFKVFFICPGEEWRLAWRSIYSSNNSPKVVSLQSCCFSLFGLMPFLIFPTTRTPFPRKIHADFTCLADCDANATPVNLLHKHIAFAPRLPDPAMQIRTLGVRYFKPVFRFVGFQLPNELFRKIRFHHSSLPLQPLCNF